MSLPLTGETPLVSMRVTGTWTTGSRVVVRVLVSGPAGGTALPMRVSLPGSVGVPLVGSVVRFCGLRVVLVDTGDRCRAAVRADRIEEVTADVRAA